MCAKALDTADIVRDAKVAMARRLAVQMFWMMRKGWDYEQVKQFGPQGKLGTGDGVK